MRWIRSPFLPYDRRPLNQKYRAIFGIFGTRYIYHQTDLDQRRWSNRCGLGRRGILFSPRLNRRDIIIHLLVRQIVFPIFEKVSEGKVISLYGHIQLSATFQEIQAVKHLEATQGVNPGRSKAEEAAKAVGGKVLLPIFAPGEAAYPKELAPVTPETYREHLNATKTLEDAQAEPDRVKLTEQQAAELKRAQLSAEQLAALHAMKRHTDFNDLATKSELGKEGIERQVNSIVNAVIEKHEVQQQAERQQERHQQQQNRRAAKIGYRFSVGALNEPY